MIYWIAVMPTPQFAPLINRLVTEKGLAIRAYYMGGRDRGWGSVALAHESIHVAQARTARGFMQGFRAVFHGRPAALVCFGYATAFQVGALLAARLTNTPVFTQSDSSYEEHELRPRHVRLIKRLLLRAVYRRDTRVWTIGPSNASYWLHQGLTNQTRVPFESPVLDAGGQPNISERLGRIRSTRHPIVLFVGRIAVEKRPEDALLAVERIRKQGVPAELVYVGVGSPALITRGRNVPAWVHLFGGQPHSELSPFYRHADVLVVPSSKEPYGLVVREALQFGLPVVASERVTAARELCDKGWNLVRVGDVHGLSRALGRALREGRWPPRQPSDTCNFYAKELQERTEASVRVGER